MGVYTVYGFSPKRKRASVGLRPKQYTKVIPRCPICGKLRRARKHIAVTTYTAKGKIASYKSVEVCIGHTHQILERWAAMKYHVPMKLGIHLDPRYSQAMEVNSGQ